MYKCEWCKEEFFEGEYQFFEGRLTEVCPRCKGEDLEILQQCEECGGYTAEEDLDEGLCPKCAGRTLRNFKSMLLSKFSPAQIEYLSQVDCF